MTRGIACHLAHDSLAVILRESVRARLSGVAQKLAVHASHAARCRSQAFRDRGADRCSSSRDHPAWIAPIPGDECVAVPAILMTSRSPGGARLDKLELLGICRSRTQVLRLRYGANGGPARTLRNRR